MTPSVKLHPYIYIYTFDAIHKLMVYYVLVTCEAIRPF